MLLRLQQLHKMLQLQLWLLLLLSTNGWLLLQLLRLPCRLLLRLLLHRLGRVWSGDRAFPPRLPACGFPEHACARSPGVFAERAGYS